MAGKKINNFLKGSNFDISLKVYDDKKLDNSYEFKPFSTSSRKAINVFLKICDFIQNESYVKALSQVFDNTFDEVSFLLRSYLNLKLKDSEIPNYIETKLKNYLEELNDFEHDPKELVDELISLKKEKVDFWNAILEEYISNREKYDSHLFLK